MTHELTYTNAELDALGKRANKYLDDMACDDLEWIEAVAVVTAQRDAIVKLRRRIAELGRVAKAARNAQSVEHAESCQVHDSPKYCSCGLRELDAALAALEDQ